MNIGNTDITFYFGGWLGVIGPICSPKSFSSDLSKWYFWVAGSQPRLSVACWVRPWLDAGEIGRSLVFPFSGSNHWSTIIYFELSLIKTIDYKPFNQYKPFPISIDPLSTIYHQWLRHHHKCNRTIAPLKQLEVLQKRIDVQNFPSDPMISSSVRVAKAYRAYRRIGVMKVKLEKR